MYRTGYRTKWRSGWKPLALGLLGGGASPLPLDLVSGAAAAYSTARRLRAAYTGSAFRLRRASDNAEQDFGFVGNAVDTAAIATFIAATTGLITTLYDQSGNGKNQAQITTANQPLYVASVQNSKPGARFDATNDEMASADGGVTGAAPHTLIAVVVPKGLAAALKGYACLGGSTVGTNRTSAIGHDATPKHWFGGDDQVGPVGSVAVVDTPYLLSKTYAGTTVLGYKNGAQDAIGTVTLDVGTAAIRVGVYATGTGYAQVDLCEFFVYASALSLSNRAMLEANINSFYSIY